MRRICRAQILLNCVPHKCGSFSIAICRPLALSPIKVGQDHLAAGDDDVVGGTDAVTDQVADVVAVVRLCYNTTWTLSLRLVRPLFGEGTVMMVMIGGNNDYGDDRRAGMICYDLSCTAIRSPLLKPAKLIRG